MPNVLVVEVRSDVVPENAGAPLTDEELAAVTRSIAIIRAGGHGITNDVARTPSVRWYRRAEQSD